MKLILQRTTCTKDTTIGKITLDGKLLCYTCEDIVRETKIAGCTAIPAGTYKVIINMSNRFKRLLPLLIAVPGFEGVRIHPGNTAADTEGCILPGAKVGPGNQSVLESRKAFDQLFALMQKATTPITITIQD